MKAPSDLKSEGRRIWKQITTDYDTRGNEPILHELARTADRLAEIRQRMTGADAATFLKLTNAEVKVSGTFARCWRLLGLQQAEIPTQGRPCLD